MKISFRGTYGVSSLMRLSAMFSNIASIFAITSTFADRWDDAMGALTSEGLSHGHMIPANAVQQGYSSWSHQRSNFSLFSNRSCIKKTEICPGLTPDRASGERRPVVARSK